MNTHWSHALDAIESLGSTGPRPGSLAGLHAARRLNLSQFFTPAPVVAVLWRIARPAMDAALAREPGSRVALLDNSCGNGRLLHPADPDKHTLSGCDVHAPSVDALGEAAEAAGFSCDFVRAGMEAVRPRGYGVALINPPFSLVLDSPSIEPLASTGWGRFGPNSSAISHAYAVDQALKAADIVLAIVPTPYADARADAGADAGRLRAVLRLPTRSFAEENTGVDVSVLVFGPMASRGAPVRIALATLDDPLPDFDLWCANTHEQRTRPLSPAVVEAGAPSITGEVTGDKTCRVAFSGRKIVLKMACAWTRARVLNAVLDRPVTPGDRHRYPKGIAYSGQGLLDLECHLAQSDPAASFAGLLNRIAEADAVPVVDPGLVAHLARRSRLRARQRVPLRHVVAGGVAGWAPGSTFEARALKQRQVNPKRWGSGRIIKDTTYTITFTGSAYELVHPTSAEVLTMDEPELRACFEVPAPGEGWQVRHPGRRAAFPEIERAVRGRMRKEGVDRITSWGFQIDDIAEASIAPGVVCAAEMGCGKTRVLLGLALLGGRRTCIVVEAHLVGELLAQIKEVGLPSADYQVITSPAQCELPALRRINIITYSRLRMEVAPGAARRTYARLLRRRFSRVLLDEAHLMRNYDSDQCRAVWQLSPRTRIAATGTPVANYPRDLLGLMIWTAGDGTAAQPFGRFHPYMAPRLVRSMDLAQTGAEVFKTEHAEFEWVTHTFEHSGLRTGAKREVPKVRNLEALRAWASCFLMRRVTREPDVAKHFTMPSFEVVHHAVEWDEDHLGWFLGVADAFGAWWREQRRKSGEEGRNVNLISLLCRIGAVLRAGTFPQHPIDGFGARTALTSKQRAVLDRAVELSEAGHKTIVFVEQPENVNLFVRELAARQVEAVPFHGGLSIAKRTADMHARFRDGAAPVLVATLGVTQTGLNLYCADRCLFACHAWTWKAISQAMGRLLRPQQQRHVIFEFFELPGSLDTYQAKMVAMKRDATEATVDFLDPEMDDEEFLHLDRVIDDFVESLARRRGMDARELRESVKSAAA